MPKRKSASSNKPGKASSKKAKQPTRNGSKTITPAVATPVRPRIPPGARPINGKNGLDLFPPGGCFLERPWFIYDHVDPAPKFRIMGEDYDWSSAPFYVAEGDNPEDLVDTHEEGKTLPVLVFGYKQLFVVTTDGIDSGGDQDNDGGLFSYQEKSLCEVSVQAVSWPMTMPEDKAELSTPKKSQLGTATVYRIHAGYRRLLLGFTREIEFMTVDKLKSHNCLFRATYLIKVLDLFAGELVRHSAATADFSGYRSQVLNPILQRQVRGVYDHEAEMVRLSVGDTLEDAAKFYLSWDPLETKHINILLRGILYIWPVRLSFALLSRKATSALYDLGRTNTEALLMDRRKVKDEEFLKSTYLYDWERRIVDLEGLERFYQDLVEPIENQTSDEE